MSKPRKKRRIGPKANSDQVLLFKKRASWCSAVKPGDP
jgi:hypothetical protein